MTFRAHAEAAGSRRAYDGPNSRRAIRERRSRDVEPSPVFRRVLRFREQQASNNVLSFGRCEITARCSSMVATTGRCGFELYVPAASRHISGGNAALSVFREGSPDRIEQDQGLEQVLSTIYTTRRP